MILCRCLCVLLLIWTRYSILRPADVEHITIGQISQWEVLTQGKIFQSFIFMLLHWIAAFLCCISRMIVFKKIECPYFSIKPLAQEPLMPYSGEQTSWMLQSSMPKSRVVTWVHAESRSVQTASHNRIIIKTTSEVKFREKVPPTASPQQKPYLPLIRPWSGESNWNLLMFSVVSVFIMFWKRLISVKGHLCYWFNTHTHARTRAHRHSC